ncbi:DUF5987 family protein [Amycolatopsis sp. lyj-108]|uniref:DUF5987 family protein n=1 Tax=Amycolatopsis sp. lyj-108 TaxID=2789286 RepID=UPI0039791566
MPGDGVSEDEQTMILEAFADTILPGAKRSPGDRAIAGVSATPGAVAAGALTLLCTPATGVTAGLEFLVPALNRHAEERAVANGWTLDETVPAFVALDFEQRCSLVLDLTAPRRRSSERLIRRCRPRYGKYSTAGQAGHLGRVAAGWTPSSPSCHRPIAPPESWPCSRHSRRTGSTTTWSRSTGGTLPGTRPC